ncbi:exodeoxyribonuclease VII large subunit [Rarobacter incanus]|uniref:Exodeoxyribonuclease 7 large subunit n=1 Tax=Rarobacter incanus TaxID=153494 RepID=A0A542SNG9_9MICO|nr:exodeoxyribonuclease VII large subunit [Rarobacter incanus]TQK76163.1 exodeoxyribonuclease VII large subunit [Rarobacter incanus]
MLPARAADTTEQDPWPVRLLSAKIEEYITRMSVVWIEGQIVQLNRRPGAGMAFLTLRDADVNESLPVSIYARVLDAGPKLNEGDRVVVRAKATFWRQRGSFQLQADRIRPVGVGDLLARIEQLKRALAGEGLFAPDKKKPLPFLPRVVGLICGRESKAEHDVTVNASARWPGVQFEIREVAVQGTQAVAQVTRALAELDAMDGVDVIVLARGGGSVEDLLPFSNETLVRAVADAITPVVSAIGHETDNPLVDFAADLRASTPTDAAKRIVPDYEDEVRGLANARSRIDHAIDTSLAREASTIAALRATLSSPFAIVEREEQRVKELTERQRSLLEATILRADRDISTLSAQVTALSPAQTLNRGYAIIRDENGVIVRTGATISPGTRITARLRDGTLDATVRGFRPTSG